MTGLEPGVGDSYHPQFRAAFRQLLGGVIVVRPPTSPVLYLNARASELLGLEIGTVLDGSEPGAREPDELSSLLGRALESEVVRGAEVSLAGEEGAVVDAVVSAAPIFDENGRVSAALGLIVEVTARRRADSLLSESVADLRRCAEGDEGCAGNGGRRARRGDGRPRPSTSNEHAFGRGDRGARIGC